MIEQKLQSVAVEHSGVPVRQSQRAARQRRHRARRVEDEAVARAQPGDGVERPAALQRTDRLAERLFAFAANDEIDIGAVRIRVRCEARVISTDDDLRRRSDLANEAPDAMAGS